MDEKIEKLVNEYYNINEEIKRLINEKDAIKAEIRLIMIEHDEEKIDLESGFSITNKPMEKRTIDVSKVKELLNEEQLESVTKTTVFQNIRIITPKQKELFG